MLSDNTVRKHTIEKNDGKKHRSLKHFYKFYVCEHCRTSSPSCCHTTGSWNWRGGHVPDDNLRQARRRQGLHIQGSVRQSVCQRHTARHQSEEQHEELSDERG